ncbi:MAG: GGDEF domain-containing protein [Myxococcota bacterium]
MARLESFATALLEAAPDAVIVSDAEGRVVLLNLQAEMLFGRSRDDVAGLDLTELLAPAEELPKLPLLVERRAGHSVERVARCRGREVPVEVTLAPVNVEGKPFTIAVLHDLTERRHLEEQLRFLSMHDALTGLANRAGFDAALALLEVRGPHPVGVVMVDLDELKQVNDERGHAAGDELLRRAAEVLRTTFRTTDVVARIGGDEFAVLAAGRDAAAIDTLARRLAEGVEAHNRRYDLPPLRVSVGTAVTSEGSSIAAALRDADARMYSMKRAHRDR